MSFKQPERFCILPWISMHINQDGRVTSCCRANLDRSYSFGQLRQNNMSEIWNGQAICEMRKNILENKELPQCRDCYDIEALGVQSYRQSVNKRFENEFYRIEQTQKNGSLVDEKISFLEIRFSNICNLRCRTCEPENSSSWYSEGEKIHNIKSPKVIIRPTQTIDEIKKDVNEIMPHLTDVSFLGGEPLLDDAHYWFLERLIAEKKTNVNLFYNTNFSTFQFKHWNVLKLWQQFENINLNASFDGVGSQAEILRKGVRWENCEKNFKLLKLFCPHARLTIYSCISVMNCFHLPEAIDRWIELGMLWKEGGLQFNILQGPECFNLKILNESERVYLKKTYSNYLEKLKNRVSEWLYEDIKSQLNYVINFLNDEILIKAREEFKRVTTLLDDGRQESLIQHFPELESLLK